MAEHLQDAKRFRENEAESSQDDARIAAGEKQRPRNIINSKRNSAFWLADEGLQIVCKLVVMYCYFIRDVSFHFARGG